MRAFKNHLFTVLAGVSALAACGIFLAVAGTLLVKGLPALRWDFLAEQMRLAGAAGGIFYNIMGTLILLVTALAVCGPLATGLALLHSVYLSAHRRSQRRLGLFLYVLNGVPSVLFGVFGLLVFVKYLGRGKSWLAGGILLGLIILPTVVVSLVERIESLPHKYLEAARGLGLSTSQTIWSVIMPQCRGGLVTGSLLGLARAAGETAPIMFTATVFAGATIPHAIKESPVLSLPYHIFILAQDSFDPSVGAKLWGTATVLLVLVFGLSVAALPLRLRQYEEGRA